jgi:hypothetical protein
MGPARATTATTATSKPGDLPAEARLLPTPKAWAAMSSSPQPAPPIPGGQLMWILNHKTQRWAETEPSTYRAPGEPAFPARKNSDKLHKKREAESSK